MEVWKSESLKVESQKVKSQKLEVESRKNLLSLPV